MFDWLILIMMIILVGVVGSGKGMTTYQQRGKHIYSASTTEES